MNFTRQKIKKIFHAICYYLKLHHAMDEWMGIYFDGENLKKAYDELVAELEEKRKVDRSYRSLKVVIWVFRPRQEYEDDTRPAVRSLLTQNRILVLLNLRNLTVLRKDLVDQRNEEMST